MGARPRSWWQTARKHPLVIGLIVLVVGSVLIFLGYRLDWHWTGFFHKTLWDWLNLLAALAIPVVAGFGVAWFTQLQQQRAKRLEQTQHEQDQKLAVQRAETEREIAVDNQREAALQGYIDNMSELLLKEGLRKSQSEDEVRKIARVRTLTVLPRLDATRKSSTLYIFGSLAPRLHKSSQISAGTFQTSG